MEWTVSDGFDSQAGDLSAGLADSISSQQTQSTPEPVEAPAAETTQEQPQQTQETGKEIGDNPAWSGIREKLGDPLYHSIKDELLKFDQNANKRISQLNEQVTRFKPFEQVLEGRDPEFLQKAVQLAEWADKDPAGLHQSLQTFLLENGRMPETAEEIEEVLEDGDEEDGVDPQVAQLSETVERMQNAILAAAQQQQLQQETERMHAQLSSELDSLRQANPWMDKEALGFVIQQAKAIHETTGKMPKLADVAQQVIQFRESVLKTPRPGDTAPRLPGAGGGMPSASKPLSQFTKADDINSLASLVQQAKQGR